MSRSRAAGSSSQGAGRLIEGLRGSFAVTRFRADGSLDRSFGRRGRRFVSFGRDRWATPVTLAIAPGGGLVVAGNAGTGIDRWQPAVARLTRSGSLDRRFGARGRVRTRLRPFGGGARAMQADALVIAGNAYSDASRYPADWALTRDTSAGRLDRGFAPDGVLRGDFSPSSDAITAIALAGDRIIAAGPISAGFGVARYVAP